MSLPGPVVCWLQVWTRFRCAPSLPRSLGTPWRERNPGAQAESELRCEKCWAGWSGNWEHGRYPGVWGMEHILECDAPAVLMQSHCPLGLWRSPHAKYTWSCVLDLLMLYYSVDRFTQLCAYVVIKPTDSVNKHAFAPMQFEFFFFHASNCTSWNNYDLKRL